MGGRGPAARAALRKNYDFPTPRSSGQCFAPRSLLAQHRPLSTNQSLRLETPVLLDAEPHLGSPYGVPGLALGQTGRLRILHSGDVGVDPVAHAWVVIDAFGKWNEHVIVRSRQTDV